MAGNPVTLRDMREVEAAVGPPVTHGAGDGVLLRGRQARVDLEGNDAVGPPELAERNDDRAFERLVSRRAGLARPSVMTRPPQSGDAASLDPAASPPLRGDP